jgi:hypothetical protein
METFLFGAAIDAGFTVACILAGFNVQSREAWDEFQMAMRAQRKLGDTLTAENSKLRVALAAGEMTKDGKKVAAMTMAALDAVIGTEEAA